VSCQGQFGKDRVAVWYALSPLLVWDRQNSLRPFGVEGFLLCSVALLIHSSLDDFYDVGLRRCFSLMSPLKSLFFI
jgi:hypothetical protein